MLAVPSCKCQIVCIKNQRRFYKKLVIHIQQKVPLDFLNDCCMIIPVIINLRKVIFCYYFVLLEVRLHMTKSLTLNYIFLKNQRNVHLLDSKLLFPLFSTNFDRFLLYFHFTELSKINIRA